MSPDGNANAARLGELVSQFMGLINRQIAGDTLAIMHEAGITLPQMVALHVLRYGGNSSINGLGEALNLSTSATSHLVDRLVERDLIHRAEDPTDRRQKRLALAPAGEELLNRLSAAREHEMLALASRLSPDVLNSVLGLLEEAVAQLRRSLELPQEIVCPPSSRSKASSRTTPSES